MADEPKPQGTHNWVHGAYQRNPRLYIVWKTMMHRCYNEKRAKFKDYGNRGITVCEEWHNPNNFLDWAENSGYQIGLQIDRIDNNGDYCPSNCKWSTPKQNSRNRRNTILLTVNGVTKSIAEWCETVSVSRYTIYWWVQKKGKEYAEQKIAEFA